MSKGEWRGCRTQLPWMADVRVGDVIAKGNGPWRIVREVTRYNNGELRSVTVAIRRCSWTRRCFTILGYTDLRILKYRRVARNAKLDGPLDLIFDEALRESCSKRPYALSCHDVRGIA